MPKSFLITNKRYKGDVLLIQKNAVTREDELIRTTRPLTTDPDDRIPDSSSPATDASGEDSGSSSGKGELQSLLLDPTAYPVGSRFKILRKLMHVNR